MSIFLLPDIDSVLLVHLDVINNFVHLLFCNKYYYELISKNKLYQLWSNLYFINKNNKITGATKNESLLVNSCIHNNLLCEYLLETREDINIHLNMEQPFKMCCQYGNLNLAKILVNFSRKKDKLIDIHIDNEFCFRMTCEKNHFIMAKWLFNLSKTKEFTIIDIHEVGEYAFTSCCGEGNFEIAKWLIDLSKSSKEIGLININVYDDSPFKYALFDGHYEIAIWLLDLSATNMFTTINLQIVELSHFFEAFKKDYRFRTLLCNKINTEIINILTNANNIDNYDQIKKLLFDCITKADIFINLQTVNTTYFIDAFKKDCRFGTLLSEKINTEIFNILTYVKNIDYFDQIKKLCLDCITKFFTEEYVFGYVIDGCQTDLYFPERKLGIICDDTVANIKKYQNICKTIVIFNPIYANFDICELIYLMKQITF